MNNTDVLVKQAWSALKSGENEWAASIILCRSRSDFYFVQMFLNDATK